jgi:hypothetical protein
MKTEEITTPAGKLDSIDHYIAAIPDYLDNQLTPAQTILFEEESRQSIPLRRALNTARDARNVPSNENQERARHGTLGFRWLAAAACVAVIAISVMLVMPELPSFDQSRLAQVEAIDGDLYQVAGG